VISGFQTVYNNIGLEPEHTAWSYALAICWNGIRWNETKHVELEQFLHAFTSRGFDSVSWAFLLLLLRWHLGTHTCIATDVVIKWVCRFIQTDQLIESSAQCTSVSHSRLPVCWLASSGM